MKAAAIHQFGTPEVLKIIDLPVPEIKDHEILVKVKASSVNPVEWKHRYGNHKWVLGSKFPVVLGYDLAGMVEKTGKNVQGFKKGDRVYARSNRRYGGAYAEYAATSEKTAAIIPGNLSFEEAAAIPLAAISALQGLRNKANPLKGEKVLIHGAASGVGHFALQLAKFYQTEVTAVCSGRHKNMMKELNADYHIDYTNVDIHNLESRFDIIFDAIGNDFIAFQHLLNPGGRYITTLPRLKLIHHKLRAKLDKGKKAKSFLMKSKGEDLAYLNEIIKTGNLKPVIDKTFSLNEIAAAHRYSESKKAAGKIVIIIQE